MAYLETAIGLSVKEILEVLIVIAMVVLVYYSHKTYLNLKSDRSLFVGSFNLINLGFVAAALSMLFELIDSFYLEVIFDNLQLVFGILGFVLLFVGFREGFKITTGGQNV